MRVAYISSAALPSREANSIHVMHMARALSLGNHEVILLAPRRKDVERSALDVWAFYGMHRSFRIERLSWWKSVVGWFIYGSVAGLRARKLDADLVYSRNLYGSWWAACVFKMPVIWEVHELPGRRFRFAQQLAKQLNACSHVKMIVAITDALREDLVAAGFDPKKISVFPDGAPASLAEPVESRLQSINVGNLQVGYVGHLYPGKGMELIAELVPLCPWADFHIIGGDDRDIAIWKARLSSCSNVRFHGFVAPAEVKFLVYGMDVALAPLRGSIRTAGSGLDISRWTSPLKIIEYMAAGRAILASDLPVLQEVLTNNVTALIRPLESPDGWAAALDALRSDRALRERLGENARREFLARYSWERRAEKVFRGAAIPPG